MRLNQAVARAAIASVTIVALLGTSLLAVSGAQAAPKSSINAQPISKLKAGGSLLLPLSQEPRQFNPLHIAANDSELSRMLSATLPSLVISDSQGKLTINKNYVSVFAQTKASPQTKELFSIQKQYGVMERRLVLQILSVNGAHLMAKILHMRF